MRPVDHEGQVPAADIGVRKVEGTRLYEALIANKVVGTLAYETTGGKITLTHSDEEPSAPPSPATESHS